MSNPGILCDHFQGKFSRTLWRRRLKVVKTRSSQSWDENQLSLTVTMTKIQSTTWNLLSRYALKWQTHSNSNVVNPIIFPSLELFNICWIFISQEAKASVQPPHVAPEVIAVLRINEHELGLRKLYQHKRLTSCASQVSFTDLVRNQKGDLLFVQLPDVLPGQVGEKCLSNLISDAGCEKRGWWVWLRHGLSWGGDHQFPINIKCQMSHYEMLHTCL